MKVVRQMKVYTRYWNPEFKEDGKYPEIKLRGNWLKDAGFNCGDSIQIIVRQNSLEIINKGE